MTLPKGWTTTTLGEECSIEIGGTPSRNVPAYWDVAKETSNLWVSIKDMDQKLIDDTAERITEAGIRHSNVKRQPAGTVLLSFKLTIGRVAVANRPLFTNEAIASLHPRTLLPDYLYYGLQEWNLLRDVDQAIKGATLNKEKLKKVQFSLPVSTAEQTKVAEVLSAVDRTIERVDAAINKQSRIMTGLAHDLLTFGVDQHGQIRSGRTHHFQESVLGLIPEEWHVSDFGSSIESAVDGPFGSNLKSEHYVAEPGVRVIRLGNIGTGAFVDADKAYVSEDHARGLARHAVRYGDVLIASLGDDRRPFGRACLYTDRHLPAIVKADVFRVRCKESKYVHAFAVHLFNCPRWRQGLLGLAQGVTRDRVNLTNLKRLQLPVPPIAEQRRISAMLEAAADVLHVSEFQRSKLRRLRSGLAHDLLTGSIRVTGLADDGGQAVDQVG